MTGDIQIGAVNRSDLPVWRHSSDETSISSDKPASTHIGDRPAENRLGASFRAVGAVDSQQ